jgi:hypothetical protein
VVSALRHFFKVRADGRRFIIRHNVIEDEWTLLSVFDGGKEITESTLVEPKQ